MSEENNNKEIEKRENEIKDIENAVKDGTSLAKNIATGNVAGAAKDAIKLAKNKKVRRRFIIQSVLQILGPLILILAAGSIILGIFDGVGDAVQSVLNGLADFFTIDYTDGSISIDDKNINAIISEIENIGVSAEDLKLLGDYSENATEEEKQAALEKYIRKFYEAQGVTQTLNYYHMESTAYKTFGAVYVYRTNEDDTDGTNRYKLTYLDYEKMKKKQEAGDDSILKNFSIDDSGKLVIAGKTTVKTEKGKKENAEQNEEISLKQEGKDDITLNLRTIDYKSAISQYTTKMNFLIYLTMISQNPEFVLALVDLIKDSRIEITIMDNVSTYENMERYTYTYNEKYKKTVVVGSGQTQREEEISGEIHKNITEITKETTVTTTPSAHITYVKTWFCEQKISYNKDNGTGPLTSEPVEDKIKDENVPSEGVTGVWKTNQTKTTTSTSYSTSYKEGTKGEVTFILGERGDAEKYKNKEIEEPTFVGLMETEFKIPHSTRKEKAGSNLVSGAEMLFYLLQKDPDLENMELIMRYALYLYSGKDYGVKELNGDIFGISDFNTTNNIFLDLAKYLRQFSHSGEAPQSSDGKYYLMYGDGKGWPTIGNADIQWKSHYTSFSVSGKILENGVEREVSNVADYVNSKLGRGPTAEYTNQEIANLNIYIEKKLVDSIGDNIVSKYYDDTVNFTAGLNLSRQQLYALTTINYNFGFFPVRNGKTFVQVYQEGLALFEKDSWQQNKYIWDNWWSCIGGGAAGHIPARDAAFETYVKGIFNFSSSKAGTVFGRNYYIYYTNEQLSRFDYAPYKPITRTSANEEEIFTYEAGLGGTILEVADQLHQAQINWTYSVGGDLFWNNIELSINNPNQVTCCATYVSSVLYLSGCFTEEEMNSFNYNSSNELYDFLERAGWQIIQNYSDLQAGDVVFMDSSLNKATIGHVQLYAGDGLWYNAGETEAIQRTSPYSQGSWANSAFMVALRKK